jgi:hypothetical protein
MGKSKQRITNWSEYNKALVNQVHSLSAQMNKRQNSGEVQSIMVVEGEVFSIAIQLSKRH